jgi:hypothetical protein
MMNIPDSLVEVTTLQELYLILEDITALPTSFGDHFQALTALVIDCELLDI